MPLKEIKRKWRVWVRRGTDGQRDHLGVWGSTARFQEGDMEHRVDSRGSWQIQLIRDMAQAARDVEGFEESLGQLLRWATTDGGLVIGWSFRDKFASNDLILELPGE